jgi:C4-dicarboxylate transporter
MITSTGLFINLIMGDYILDNYRFNYLFLVTGCVLLVMGVIVIILVDCSPNEEKWADDLLVTKNRYLEIIFRFYELEFPRHKK